MYRVVLINNNEEISIHENSIEVDAPKIEGKIKRGINTINSFTFTILQNNQGYNSIIPFRTRVEVINTITNTKSFEGRVLLSTPSMDTSGLHKIDVVCESELGYLHDSQQRYGEYHNVTVREFLQIMIDRHNASVEEHKHFRLGIIEVTDSNNSLYRYLDYNKSTLDNIKDKLLDRLGGELRVRKVNGIRYLDYLNRIGEVKDNVIRLSKNLKTITQEKDPSKLISKLIPYGAKLKDSEERLTIKDVNNGLDYIQDNEAINKFGIKEVAMTWDDVNVPSILLNKGEQYLAENNRLLVKYKISVLDLSLLGLEVDSIYEGNDYHVINEIMGIDNMLRVIEIEMDINSQGESNIVVGDKFEDIKDYQVNMSSNIKVTQALSSTIGTTINTVKDINTQVIKAVEITEQNTQDIHLSKQDISTVMTEINAIKASLKTTDDTLKRLIKRHNMGV